MSEATVRQHLDVAAYRERQAAKLAETAPEKLAVHGERLRRGLTERLDDFALQPGTAVCLGARTGAEVLALLDCGWFAVGIDLATTPEGAAYVLAGDMHALAFPSGSVDLVYTNAIYEARDLGALLTEIRRVLRPNGGLLLTEVGAMTDGVRPVWQQRLGCDSADDFVRLMRSHRWNLIEGFGFWEPWQGNAFLWETA